MSSVTCAKEAANQTISITGPHVWDDLSLAGGISGQRFPLARGVPRLELDVVGG